MIGSEKNYTKNNYVVLKMNEQKILNEEPQTLDYLLSNNYYIKHFLLSLVNVKNMKNTFLSPS